MATTAFSFRNLFNNNTIVMDPYGLICDKVRDSLRIAHLSDLHEKRFGTANEQLFEAVSSIQPDIIAVTGDLVAHTTQKAADLEYTEELARGLAAIAPTFAVTGNHEAHFVEEVCDTLRRNGVRVLRGEREAIEVRGTTVNVAGVDDPVFGMRGLPEIFSAFSSADTYNLLLTHRPELFPILVEHNVDLVLAGHTHAGQIRLPQISSFYMPGQGFFPKYMEGECTVGATTMIISRGLGSSGYPTFRINNPPDLVAIEVRGAPPEDAE